MANPYRGEIAVSVDGQSHTLRLTLGALAHLEQQLGVDDLSALFSRMLRGPHSTHQVEAVLTQALLPTVSPDRAAVLVTNLVASQQAASTYVRLMRASFAPNRRSSGAP